MNIELDMTKTGKKVFEWASEKITDVFVVTAEPEGMERVRRFVPKDGNQFEYISEKIRQAVNPVAVVPAEPEEVETPPAAEAITETKPVETENPPTADAEQTTETAEQTASE